MGKSAQPLFLARRAYRRRRMMDAVRLLPILGAVLILIPGYWHVGDTTGAQADTVSVAAGGLYLFAVWLGLVVLAFGLARGLGPTLTEEELPESSTPEQRIRAEAAALAQSAD
ncbi:hypothetical protein BFP70_10795 [Thioclava sp. SK-1]|uniref:hypothetical protein n=1 Tax=Thioclava sp. SK-1 TaxID=1889770 RepID=UPI0008254C10|nr:hypothetical protein [Thioclava sp. SK-1]OCX64520.1 hypothetical protein BFP70_10795 [Thioclava sp. SK-1]